MLPLVARVADLPPGGRRTLTSLELGYFPAVAIVTARHDVERLPDAGGHRVVRIATARGGGDPVTSELVVDRDGLVVARTDGAPLDTRVTRR